MITVAQLRASLQAAPSSLGRPIAQAALLGLGLCLLVVLELYSAWYAFASALQTDLWQTPFGAYPRAALLHSALCLACGLLAFFGMHVAARLKDDPRPHIASRAFGARLVALGCLLIPISYLSGAFAHDRASKAWDAYVSSPAYAADTATAQDPRADFLERREARERITPPTSAERSFMDIVKACFLHGLVLWSASAFHIPAPATAADRERVRKDEDNKRRRERAKERERERAKEQKRLERLARAGILSGGNVAPFPAAATATA